MKKLFAASSAIIATLFSAFPAFAQTNVNVCPQGGKFGNLCAALQANKFGEIVGTAITVIFVIAIVIALFYLIWGGIKWVLSGGDKAAVDAARQTIIAAIIGLVIVFVAYFVLQIILSLFGLGLSDIQLPKLPGT